MGKKIFPEEEDSLFSMLGTDELNQYANSQVPQPTTDQRVLPPALPTPQAIPTPSTPQPQQAIVSNTPLFSMLGTKELEAYPAGLPPPSGFKKTDPSSPLVDQENIYSRTAKEILNMNLPGITTLPVKEHLAALYQAGETVATNLPDLMDRFLDAYHYLQKTPISSGAGMLIVKTIDKEKGDALEKWIDRTLGLEPGGSFEKAIIGIANYAPVLRSKKDSLDPSWFANFMGKGIGGPVTMVPEFVANVPWAVLDGAAQTYERRKELGIDKGGTAEDRLAELGGAFKEGFKRWVMGRVLHYAGYLKKAYAVPAMGGIFGTQALIAGAPPEEIAENIGTGVMYALVGKSGKASPATILNEIFEKQGIQKGNLYEQLVDQFDAINSATKQAGINKTIPASKEPKFQVSSWLGLHNKVQGILEDATIEITKDSKYRPNGESFKRILNDTDMNILELDPQLKKQNFQDYCRARQIEEDLKIPRSDWSDETIATPKQQQWAADTLKKLQEDYKDLSEWEKLRERYTAFQFRVSHMAVDAGVMSEQQFKDMQAKHPHYVPSNRLHEILDPDNVYKLPTSVGPMGEITSPFFKLKGGSDLPYDDMYLGTITSVFRVVDAAEKNLIKSKYVNAVQPVFPDKVINRPYGVHPIRVNPEEINTILTKLKDVVRTQTKVREETTGTPKATPEMQKTSLDKLEKVVTDALITRGMTKGEADTYVYKIKEIAKGKGESIDPPIIERVIEHFTNSVERILIEPQESIVWRANLRKPKGNVIEYREDGVRKAVEVPRKVYEAMEYLNKAGVDIFTKFLSGPAHWLRVGATTTPEFWLGNFFRDQPTAFIQSRVGFVPFWDPVKSLALITNKEDIFLDMKRHGGGSATFTEMSRDNLGKMIDEFTRNGRTHKFNIITKAQDISQLFEQATRVALYKRAIKQGKHPLEAAYISREGTVDFGRTGSQTANLNKTIAFFNAGLQGFDRTRRAFVEDPKGTIIKSLAVVTIPSIISYTLSINDPDYFRLPRWRRDLFWNFRVPGTSMFASIPKPFIYGQLFGTSVERFMDYAIKKDPHAWDDLVSTVIDSVLPSQGDPAAVIIPTVFKPLLENQTSWSFFKQQPLITARQEKLLASEQYGPYTSEVAKNIGAATGISPTKFENTVTGWFGGMGRYALQAADIVAGHLPGEKRPPELSDIPLVKRFVNRPVESQPESLRRFYEMANELSRAHESYTKAIEANDVSTAVRISAKYPVIEQVGFVQDIHKQINEITDTINTITVAPMSITNKRAIIKKYEQDRMLLAEQAVTLIEQITKYKKSQRSVRGAGL